MNLLAYFSKDEDKRARYIFNLIAPVYHLIDKGTYKDYLEMARVFNSNIPLKGKAVLDVGSGTGSWLAALNRYSLGKATGVDFSDKMLFEAQKVHPDLEFVKAAGEDLTFFKDKSYDVVTATFVLHGMKSDKRKRVLLEMKRVAREFVVIHDFYGKTEWITRILESLEKSDYKNFKLNFSSEMQSVFSETEVIPAKNAGRALYIGKI